MVLLDGGAHVSSISRKWVDERDLPVYELEDFWLLLLLPKPAWV